MLKKIIALVILICCVSIESAKMQPLDDTRATHQIQSVGQKFTYPDIEVAFDSITPFINSCSIVSSVGRFGVINTAGEQIVPCIYDLVEFAEDCFIIHQNGRKGLTDHNGKILIEPSYSELLYHDGTAAVCYWWSDFGVVDKNGQMIIPMLYENAAPFENTWAWVQEKDTYLSNYMNRNGDFLFPDWLISPVVMEGDYAIGRLKNGSSILLNVRTKEALYYPSAEVAFIHNGLVLVEGSYMFRQKDDSERKPIKLYDIMNNTYIRLEYDTIQPFAFGLAAVCSKGNWGYINEDYELVIPLKYTHASPFFEERAWVAIDGNQAVIDLQGNVVFCDKDNVVVNSCIYSEGVAAIETRDGWGFIDRDGKIVCEPQYRADSNNVVFRNGFCNLINASPYQAHYIDHRFQTVIEFDIYDYLE